MTVDELLETFHIGPRFLQALLAHWGRTVDELLADGPGSTSFLWQEFALTTNLRGEKLASEVAAHVARGSPLLHGLRTLDVGCAHGGVAVACARLGADSWGIDINGDLLGLAKANAADWTLPIRVEEADLLDPGLSDRIGRFDAVTAHDVLEHLVDARAGVHALRALMAPGGLVIATIPNGDAVSFVKADGHYLLPGLTLLRHRPDAVAYHAARYPGGDYSVGQYYSIDEYQSWFAEAGLSISAIDHITPTPLSDFHADLAAAEAEVGKAIADKSLNPSVRGALQQGIEGYRKRVKAALDLDPVEAERHVTAQFWEITASLGPLRRVNQWRPRRSQFRAAFAALRRGLRRAVRRVAGGRFAA